MYDNLSYIEKLESIRQYIVDAFTGAGYRGNPAAVCLLGEWLSEEQMTSIAARNGLSETAFIVRNGGRYGLRWFTPKKEIDLCGHATLASAFVINTIIEPNTAGVELLTQSGTLRATAAGCTAVCTAGGSRWAAVAPCARRRK